jgi:hypothetical protein
MALNYDYHDEIYNLLEPYIDFYSFKMYRYIRDIIGLKKFIDNFDSFENLYLKKQSLSFHDCDRFRNMLDEFKIKMFIVEIHKKKGIDINLY